MNELASEFGVHSNRVSEWKQVLLQDGAQVLASANMQRGPTSSTKETEFYEQIGRLSMELEWLKNVARNA